MSSASLTPQQENVLQLISEGSSQFDAALSAGIERRAIAEWTQALPHFASALAIAHREQTQSIRDQAISLMIPALDVIRAILLDPECSPSIRLRAVAVIVKLAAEPKQPPAGPKTPQAQAEHPLQNAAFADLMRISTGPGNQIREDHSRTPAQPSRNALCPCKSGLKYKRCCANRQKIDLPAQSCTMAAA